ncbi:hypothetical protein NIES267_75150 (plasmid) [Calothrix parasitica NIES-267]|uniref:Uncharacterized protein n=1 Tax=Calothrix parasitica NIES-267 TaxID=1973488 RepID=A0A1Z4M3A6_9CYAN|nr:hypothetical protein NIES267_75150 [Calothrix parasitica NIES-267]
MYVGVDMTRVERESMNFKLPKPLAEALRKKASPQPGKTATDIVIRGLLHELGDIPGVDVCTEVRLQKVEEQLQQLAQTISKQGNKPSLQSNASSERTEEKLEALNNRVAQLEGALIAIQRNGGASNNYRRYKNSGNPYNQSGRPPQIEALDEEKLALRLNVNIPTLQEKHATLDKREFEEWSKERDRSKYMWRFSEKDKLYHPVK